MRSFNILFKRLSNLIGSHFYNKQEDPRSYFDFSAEEKKRVINKAAKEAVDMQMDLLKEYEKKFPKEGQEKFFYRT